jgi:hypothetical protein
MYPGANQANTKIHSDNLHPPMQTTFCGPAVVGDATTLVLHTAHTDSFPAMPRSLPRRQPFLICWYQELAMTERMPISILL